MGKFLDGVIGQQGPRPAADRDPIEGGDALETHLAKRAALNPEDKRLMMDASPKFSTGARSSIPTFPTKTATTRKAP